MAIPIGTTTQSGAIPVSNSPPATEQFGRSCTLLVSNSSGKGLDLSALRIKFNIKRSISQTPNTASIRVYNLSSTTALQLKNDFNKARLVLQAGYTGNAGVIFSGNIIQTITGRESATDTFVEFIAGDGDTAYNFTVVSTPIGAGLGATYQEQINTAVDAMKELGINGVNLNGMPEGPTLPRGKVFHGCARDILRDIAQSTQSSWSIQDEKVIFIPRGQYLPGAPIIINQENGMVGSPQQTLDGVNAKCLLNPLLKVGTRFQLNLQAIQRLAINLNAPGTAANIPATLTVDGTYFAAVAEHIGDTRGIEWYTSLVGITIDPTLVGPSLPVPVSYD